MVSADGILSACLHVAVGLMGRNQTWTQPAAAAVLCSK